MRNSPSLEVPASGLELLYGGVGAKYFGLSVDNDGGSLLLGMETCSSESVITYEELFQSKKSLRKRSQLKVQFSVACDD